MSWLQKLYETYELCAGHEPDGMEKLKPISHTTQLAQIEVVIDSAGKFRRARVLEKSERNTLIPCTEESAGRSGKKPVHHPLCDKLQYIARDFNDFGTVTIGYAKEPKIPYENYLSDLKAWRDSVHRHDKLDAIAAYVIDGSLIRDLEREKVLHLDPAGRLMSVWQGSRADTPPIFKAIGATQEQDDVFVRWAVESADEAASGTWQDVKLIQAWIDYYSTIQSKQGHCAITGKETAVAVQHPAKLRHGGDKAKLISSNDSSGFTFLGKFLNADEAVCISFEVTQKAHSALQWLIAQQAYYDKASGQVFVAWSCDGSPVPNMLTNSMELLEDYPAEALTDLSVNQEFALRLNKAIAGYKSRLNPGSEIAILGLDAATPGRMAAIFYRELKGSEFLDRIETWHRSFSWLQNFGKDSQFIGAPAPKDIAEAAFGRRLDEKLQKATIERLLPCIVDKHDIPYDLVLSTTRRASNRVGLNHWEWEKCLGIACALFNGYHTERRYNMALEPDRTTRDYLYGRLLAIAENIESRALFIANEKRDTSAARLMQRFSERPFSTWKTIELSLTPYRARLRSQRAGWLFEQDSLLDDVNVLFIAEQFIDDSPLTGEFLLGYHCQREVLRKPKIAPNQSDTISDNEE